MLNEDVTHEVLVTQHVKDTPGQSKRRGKLTLTLKQPRGTLVLGLLAGWGLTARHLARASRVCPYPPGYPHPFG